MSAVDRVVINRVFSATHGNHFDQRQVRGTPTCAGMQMPSTRQVLPFWSLDSREGLLSREGTALKDKGLDSSWLLTWRAARSPLQVVLDCSAGSSSTIACAGPPNSSIAPPGQYMLFAVANGVPSIAPYVSLQTKTFDITTGVSSELLGFSAMLDVPCFRQ